MAEIMVNAAKMYSAATAEKNVAKRLDGLSDEIANVQRNLSFQVKSRAQISLQLVALEKVCETNATRVRRLSSTLESAINNYSATERRVSGHPTGGKTAKKPKSGKGSKTGIIDVIRKYIKKLVDEYNKDPKEFQRNLIPIITLISPAGGIVFGFATTAINGGTPIISGTKKINGKVFGLPAGVTAKGDMFGYSGKVQGKYEHNWTKGNVGIKGVVSGEAHLAQGSVKGHLGPGSVEMKGTVGQVSAKGEAGISLMKDGKFSPSVEAKVKAEAVGIKGEIKQQIGNSKYNVHSKAEGSVGVARAEAGGGIGKFSYEENGVKHSAVGAYGKAGAEVCAAEGKVSGGFTIFGVKIDVGVSGKAGAIGASAEGRVTASGAKGSIGGAFGVGGGVTVSIDWSSLFNPNSNRIF